MTLKYYSNSPIVQVISLTLFYLLCQPSLAQGLGSGDISKADCHHPHMNTISLSIMGRYGLGAGATYHHYFINENGNFGYSLSVGLGAMRPYEVRRVKSPQLATSIGGSVLMNFKQPEKFKPGHFFEVGINYNFTDEVVYEVDEGAWGEYWPSTITFGHRYFPANNKKLGYSAYLGVVGAFFQGPIPMVGGSINKRL